MKLCVYCKSENTDNAAVCKSCGSNDLKYVCSNCKTVFMSGFCPNCGTRAGEAAKVCPSCGAAAFSVYCPDCGTALKKKESERTDISNIPPSQPVSNKKSKSVFIVLMTVFVSFIGALFILLARITKK